MQKGIPEDMMRLDQWPEGQYRRSWGEEWEDILFAELGPCDRRKSYEATTGQIVVPASQLGINYNLMGPNFLNTRGRDWYHLPHIAWKDSLPHPYCDDDSKLIKDSYGPFCSEVQRDSHPPSQ